MNRTAPLQGDYSFTIYNIPGAATAIGPQNIGNTTPPPPFRVRAVCSDGTVGETELAFPEFGSTAVYTGEIFWRPATPIPLGVALTAAQNKLTANQSTQLTTTGVLANAATVDLTARIKGTLYTSSNPLIATVNDAGLASVVAQFASGSAARVVMTAQNEGVAGTTVLQVGPRGRLSGRIYRADGTTPVTGARVTVIRNQPRESLGTVTSDAGGNYVLDDVSAGAFSVSVIEPDTGDLGRGDGMLQTEGEIATIDVRLNGQGTVNVTVVNGADAPVANALVTFTSLTGYRDIRTLQTNSSGQVVLERALAGQFTVSTRDTATNLVGTALGSLLVGGTANVTLKLQPVGAIAGVVYATDGTTVQSGIQVRLVSAVRGIVTQVVTGEDGKFRFDALPLSNGPYTLDAMQNGRLRARVPNLILTQAGQELARNIVFAPAGMVSGVVTRNNGSVVEGATVTVQSLVGQRFAFSTKSDAQGRYIIDGVPVGAFGLTASAGSGEVGSGGGNIASDGENLQINLQLAANGIVGTVFNRDGVTPVGAGVAVTLKPGNATTQTNAQGQYGFSVAQPSTYTVEAADANGNRGRSSVVLTAITPGDPKTLNVVFLARGTVQGSVRDPNGSIQTSVPVTLTSSSLFGGTATTNSDSEGRYRFDGVFVGEFSVYARNASTNLAGFGRGRLAENDDVVTADVTLAATGSVSGKVVSQDNATAVPGAIVEFNIGGTAGLRATADAEGNFNFPVVPLGDFSLLATNPANGDKGQVVSRLVTLNEARAVNIRLLGQGAVRVRAIDGANQPIQGVAVAASSASQFGGTFQGVTGADGLVTFSPVFNGDVNVTGEKGAGIDRISGFGTTTIVGGATAEVTLTLLNKPVGAVAGVVTKGLASDPQSGVTVRLSNNNTGAVRSVVTAADGAYRFDLVEVGPNYRVTALINNRVRARSDVTLSTANETVTRNLVLIGVGTVSGLATNAQNQAQPGIYVTLSNPDPTYGGSWSVTTQADGSYSFANVPAGNFTVRARSNDGRLQAQNSGTVRFDADVVTVNLTLVDNAVNLPINLYDANGARFDLQGDGSVRTGINNVFNGNAVADARASRLEIVVNGVAVPFQNGDGTIGRLTQLGQLLEVDDFHEASGLDVTRRIYIPKNGYFSRTLEVLENRTANPVTVGVKLVSNIAPGVVGARVVDTSSNDSVLDISADASRDRWAILDDDRDADPFEEGGNPSVAMVFDGVNADINVAEAAVTAVSTVAKVSWQWSNITIPPGASAALIHFNSQQLGRIPARAAAERLVQLPPEALEGLTSNERAIILNFKMPVDGLSTLQPLPNLENTVVTGTVLAGDGTTPIANAPVALKSENVLFGRVHRTSANASGSFSLSSQRFGQSNVVAIAQDRFAATATHPRTSAVTAPAAGNFDAGQTSVQQDLIFIGTGNLTGTVKRHTGAAVTSGTVSIPYRFPGSTSTQALTTSIDSSGSFKYTGISSDDYLATATQGHPQGQALNGSASGSIGVPSGTTTVVAITMEETGEITGTVRAANGEPVVNAGVELDPSIYGAYRYTQTDTGGNYRFTDVRLGSHTVRASGNNGLQETGTANVVKDTAAVVNLQLAGTGQVSVQVNYQRGVPAVNAYVELVGRAGGSTNGAGQVSFSAPSDIALTIRARHPDNGNLMVSGTATIAGNGGTAEITLALPPAGSITGTLLRPDGSTPASGVSVTVRRQDGTVSQSTVSTNAAGVYRFNGLPLAPYSVSAEDRATFKFAYAETTLASDGQETTVNLRLADNRIALPADLRDANDFLFDIQQNGSIGAGWRARWSTTYSVFQNSGSQLEINGTAFAGDVGAFLEAGRRQFAITQQTPLAGLNVSRKIFVPRGGYFARYLEVLENPGSSPVDVTVKVKSRFRNTNTGVVNTSSGDTQLQASGAQRDTWVVTDDGTDADPFLTSSQPATSLVLGPSDGTMPHDQLEMNYSSGTSLIAGWSNVTVPANGRVILMHFQVQQINRASAMAAAERLQQLPPEALDSLSSEEIAAISNFALPGAGQSSIAALPSLLGRVSGVVYEGDRQTVVPSASIEIRSSHPLFGRTWMRSNTNPCDRTIGVPSLVSTATGAYSLTGILQDVGSIPLPVGSDISVKAAQTRCYSLSGLGHPLTRVPSQTFTAAFADAANEATQDVVFDTGILTGTVVGPSDYGVGGGAVRTVMPANVNSSSSYTVAVTIANDGAYLFPGLPVGSRELTSTVPHNQGAQLLGIPLNATVTAGQTTVADINIEPTGSVSGAVVTANGEASVASYISLTMNGGARSLSRSSSTDSLGRFNFSAVPVGVYTLSVSDARTSAITSAVVTVTQNQVTVQNLTLVGTGSIQLTVNFARGTAAANVDVYMQSSAVNSSFYYKGRTDAQGRLAILVPVGTYTIRVAHPLDGYNSGRWVESSGTIATNNESRDATLVLGAHAAVRVTVVDQDAGNAPIVSAQVTLTDSACESGCGKGSTNGSGQLLIPNVQEGTYTITARTQEGRIVVTSGVIDASVDGQTLEKTLSLTATADKLGVFTYVGERHLYSIAAAANDVISVGISGAVVNAGPSAYLTNVQVFDTTKVRVAEGYGYDSRSNYNQYNAFGNLQNIVASNTGNYTIAVNPYYSNVSYLGGYRLQVRVNGVAVEIPTYLDGGTVQGTITKSDSSPAVSQMVQIQTDDVLRLSMRTETDSAGLYQFGGVPVSGFTVSALDATSKNVLASASDAISAAAQIITKDLRIPPKTTLQVQVSIPGGLSIPSQLYFQVTDMGGTRQEGPVTFASGETISSVRTVAVYGDQATVRVVHPNNSSISASSAITGAEGQTIPVTLTLAAAGVQGRVLNGAGEPVGGIYVRARVAANNNSLGAMYTNSQGNYLFAALPVGEEILLQAQEPNTAVLTVLRTTLQLGETVTRDIQLTGIGTVSGVVSRTSGGVIPDVQVVATYVYDDINNYTTQKYVYSNQAGEYSIPNIPVGRDITVTTSVYTGFTTIVGTGNTTLASHGQNGVLNLPLDMSGGSVFVRVLDADNQPVPYSCRNLTIQAANGQSGTMNWQNCGVGITFDAVPAGQATITGNLDYIAPLGPVTFDVVEGQRTDVVLTVSLVKGVVRLADGTPIPWPSVTLTNETQFLYAETNELGEYRIYGAAAGAFTVRAEDNDSGLSATASGNLVDPGTSIALNVTMPPTGTVTGTFRDRDDQPIANAEVYVRSSAVDVDRYATTDSNGVYRVEKVALGNITVVARGPYPGLLIAMASGQIAEAGSVLTLDLRANNATNVAGQVLNEAGGAVSSASVSLSTRQSYGPFGTISRNTTADASGNFSLSNVPAGDFRLVANSGGIAGFVDGTAVADTALTLNVTIGGAVVLPHIFSGTDTSRYDVYCDGRLSDGGFANRGDAYDGAYYLKVNGNSFPCNSVAPLSNGGREVLIGPNIMENLQVSRRVYVPTSGGYARYLDTLSNPTASDITIAVKVDGNLGSDSGTRLIVSPTQSGGRYAVTTDQGYDPALAHVFASTGAPLTGTQMFNPPNDQFSYDWNVTIPAGGTVSLLHFAVQRAASDATAAQAQAEALSTMTQSGMFEGLSSADRANIKNFVVSP
ncbi:MAG: hypothetical protein A3I66_10075 [Burkholderiales bacterium RIFCSPLOWO2_02_FULL_57_36]|nr:MAG: hypothetical protein A3I66_10075 [Burkholderiales bacterium RIFCSPLOWO2_02_FULL_57_36]